MSKDTLLENYADVDDISRRLGIHPESVRRLIRDGKLPAIKFGNKWLVEKSVLEQFASGYDGFPQLAEDLASVPVVTKPYTGSDIAAAIARLSS